jgi:hypothetical protein
VFAHGHEKPSLGSAELLLAARKFRLSADTDFLGVKEKFNSRYEKTANGTPNCSSIESIADAHHCKEKIVKNI